MEITIPYNFQPRGYQTPLYNCVADGFKRAVAVWHRRSGKDKTLLNLIVKEAHKRIGVYYYFFPTYNQGRKVLWDGIDRDGFRYMDHIPEALRGATNQQEMKIRLKCGSIIQIIGTDNIDAIMGTNPVGCVFSEYSLQNPEAWDLIRPILAENGGWAVFNYTPRGRNHGYVLYEMAKNNPEWFCELLTVDDTGGVVTPATIQAEREAGMSEEMINQEFYCSFEAALLSCFFAGVLDGHTAVTSGAVGKIEITREKEIEFADGKNGILEVWRHPYFRLEKWDKRKWKYRYCIGSDISEGLGVEGAGTKDPHDYSVAYVYDRELKQFVARMRSKTINSHTWGDRLFDLSRYYENALIVPERNGAGITTIDRLITLKANIYVREKVNEIGKQITKQYGFLETTEAKQLICGTLKSYLATKRPVYCRHLLSECATFIKDEEKEKLGADEGFHDDCVIAAALALHGDFYLPKCEKIPEPMTGWRAQREKERKAKGVWAN
ncbi:MAG TPA: hypothetical protein PK022_06865 [Syntrophales bacterium]|nr:hypothetical protein [Syntrophales bacterium]